VRDACESLGRVWRANRLGINCLIWYNLYATSFIGTAKHVCLHNFAKLFQLTCHDFKFVRNKPYISAPPPCIYSLNMKFIGVLHTVCVFHIVNQLSSPNMTPNAEFALRSLCYFTFHKQKIDKCCIFTVLYNRIF
jgi:hypothetical protein